jgi:endonuclease/exonuclease/phosphatase family protein
MQCLSVLALLCALLVSPLAYAQPLQFGALTVYTRNLYIGTDFAPVLAAVQDTPNLRAVAQAAFEDIARTNFPRRAEALAAEIEALQPHLIGLQEVFNFTLNGAHNTPPFVDYLETLLAALTARGLHYRVAAVVNNIDLTFRFDLMPPAGDELIEVVDRDVILARSDVPTTVAAFPCTTTYPDHTPADGCNYTVLLPLVLPAPFPPSAVFRGFVGVDAVVDGATYRFVTTHLEVQAVGTAIQQAQAAELVGTIGLATPPHRPIILVGDFNSAPTEPAGAVYDIIRAAAYADTWQHNSVTSPTLDGFTCCQASDLTNDVSLLDRRIDHIFVKNNLGVLPFSFPGLVFATVIGDAPISTSPPQWSSDHAGPLAVLLGIPLFEPLGSLQHAGTP